MKNTVRIITLTLLLAISVPLYVDRNDYFSKYARMPNIVENRLLKKINANDNADYTLVRFRVALNGGDRFIIDVADDDKLLIENADFFFIRNKKEAYGTTCEGFFKLYRNGKLVDGEIYDPYMEVTEQINYGSLKNAFVTVPEDKFHDMISKKQ